jgi:hypothetical protein
VGGAFGLAVLASLSTTRTGNLRAAGESTASALTGGYHFAFVVAAGLVGASIVIALTVLRGQPLTAAEQEVQFEGEPAYQEAA